MWITLMSFSESAVPVAQVNVGHECVCVCVLSPAFVYVC